MKRSTVLSDAQEAAADVRKVCNSIKRASAVVAAAMHAKVAPDAVANLSEKLALGVLDECGFDTGSPERLATVLPMMVEATSNILASASRWSDHPMGPDELERAAQRAASSLADIAKSRAVARMVEPLWPGDIDSVTAMRLTAASALSVVAAEVAEFDFMHPASECIKEAGKVVVTAALAAAKRLAVPGAASGAMLMLSQSMVTAAAKVYAAVWRSEAANMAADLDAMPHAQREAELERMASKPLAEQLARVNERFSSAFGETVESAHLLLNEDTARPKRLPGLKPR